MKRIFLLLIFSFSLVSFSQTASEVTQKVENLNSEFESAISSHDTQTLNLLVSDIVGLNNSGSVTSEKEAAIQELTRENYKSFETKKDYTGYYVYTVIIMGREEFVNRDSVKVRRSYTNVWCYHENGWELVARHVN